MLYCTYSALGVLTLESDGKVLTRLWLESEKKNFSRIMDCPKKPSLVSEAFAQLEAYLQKHSRQFQLPLAPQGTPFQLQTWEMLKQIPYGETISYRELAVRLGRPLAARAVGQALHRNPLPLIIPCHRVIGSSGRLTGFRAGVQVKKWLLELEASNSKEQG